MGPRRHRVKSDSLRFTPVGLGDLGFVRVRMGLLCVPRGRLVDWGSLGFTPARIGVAVFIRVRVGSHGRALCSSG